MDHKPYIRHVPGSRCAVLMIHGIVGTPAQFRQLLPVIPEDWSVYNILLEGHGGTVQDFSRSSMARWRLQVASQLELLFSRHRKVLIVAHSMGTLFAIRAAIENPHRIPALFLLQIPLIPHLPPSTCISALTLALGKAKPGTGAWAMRHATAMTLTPRLWQYLPWIPQYIELFREISQVKQLLPRLEVPCKSFSAAHDELVSRRTQRCLYGHPFIRDTLLPNSGHFSYAPEDAAFLRQQLTETIKAI